MPASFFGCSALYFCAEPCKDLWEENFGNVGVEAFKATGKFMNSYSRKARCRMDDPLKVFGEGKEHDPYQKSKTLAERAAWDWSKGYPEVEVVTVCPALVFGPVLGKDYSTSIQLVARLMNGESLHVGLIPIAHTCQVKFQVFLNSDWVWWMSEMLQTFTFLL